MPETPDARGARSGASPSPWGKRLALAAAGLVAGAAIVWDAAQLSGAHGAERARAAAALVLHPVRSLHAQREGARRQAELRAVWVKDERLEPSADALLAALARADADGLDADALGLPALRSVLAGARAGDRQALEQAPGLLWDSLVGYVTALRSPAAGVQTVFADPAVTPAPPSRDAIVDAVLRAPSLDLFLAQAHPANPLYQGLRRALSACGDEEASARCGPVPRDLLLANLERARALPADLGARFILVNVPEQRLWLYENGRVVDSMPVVVGKLSQPTPELSGVVRYALFNPYWNIPPDLTRDNVAPAVLREGVSYLKRQRLEVMSDWSEAAHPVDPESVDWPAVADGRESLHVRQLPGPENMMGKVKFMLPNALGIYLHDTPHRAAFGRALRAESSGCVRLEDAPRLARWLLQGQDAPKSPAPELRVNVPRPTPVYITYLTVRPEGDGVVAAPDLYGRDPQLVASLRGSDRAPAKASMLVRASAGGG